MPITLFVSEGALTDTAQTEVFGELTDIFLRHHNLSGNAFLTPNVIGEVNEIPRGKSFAGGKQADIAIVELKVPSFALGTPEQKQSFVADATDAVLRAGQGRLGRDRVWVNMVYAVDGLWGVQGQAYTNDQLLHAVSQAAAA
jgi:phenylpyruvate tautomerase PptA (4-oxalocrotonate tautomerase family)